MIDALLEQRVMSVIGRQSVVAHIRPYDLNRRTLVHFIAHADALTMTRAIFRELERCGYSVVKVDQA